MSGIKKSLCVIIFSFGLFGLADGSWAKTITYQVADSQDDTAAVSTESDYGLTYMYVPYSDSSRSAFWRWALHIPKGATIDSAYLRLNAASGSGANVISLNLVDQDNCPNFYTNPFSYATTGPTVQWSASEDWSDGTWYTSADIKNLVQSFIDRPGYSYGNYIGLRAQNGSGSYRTVYQYDAGADKGAQLVINYTGGEVPIELWMAEPHVRTRQYIYVQTWNVDASDTLTMNLDGGTVFGPVTFGSNYIDRHETKILVDYTSLTASTHTLTATVRSSGGATRGSASKTWTTLHSGYPKVGIDENNSLCLRDVGGTSCTLYFSISAFLYDRGRWQQSICGIEGGNKSPVCTVYRTFINSLLSMGYEEGGHTIQNWKTYLDAAWTTDSGRSKPYYVIGPHGFNGGAYRGSDLNAWANNSRNCTSPIDQNDCSYINYTKDHPAVLAWSAMDEPNIGPSDTYSRVSDLIGLRDALRNNDTNHPFTDDYIGYDWNDDSPQTGRAREYAYLYNGHQSPLDMIGFDYYPYEMANYALVTNLETYLSVLDKQYQWNYFLHPVWVVNESNDLENPQGLGGYPACESSTPGGMVWTPPPTGSQLKNENWMAIIHGAKAIDYFPYFCLPTDDEARYLTQFKTDVENLTRPILSAVSEKGVYSPTNKIWASASVVSGARVDYTVRDYNGNTYIFAGRVKKKSEGWPDSSNNHPVTATFSLSGMSGTQTLRVYGEGRNVSMANGTFSDTFNDYDVHIYTTDTGGSDTTPPAAPSGLTVE